MNFNGNPYFDDFDPLDNFYRVLFRPGRGVQARELNQLQAILQHQVSTVGNHLFKKNSMVIPGGVDLVENADIVSVEGFDAAYDINDLIGKQITNAEFFDATDDSSLDGSITAIVHAVKAATLTEPAALYVTYQKTQTDGRQTFNLNEVLKTVDDFDPIVTFNVDSTVGSTVGKVATIEAGTYYTKETFVDNDRQSTIVEVVSSITKPTTCVVGLNVLEYITTSDDDQSLLDNATGTPNEYAPGADRYTIRLELVRIDATTVTSDDNFIKLLEVKNNVITYLNNNTQYAEIMKVLAQRTYDANGNFVVDGLDSSITADISDERLRVNISKGKCYLGGYEYNQISDVSLTVDKPRSDDYIENARNTETPLHNTYFICASDLKAMPEKGQLIQFVDYGYIADANAITTQQRALVPEENKKVVGHGIFRGIEWYDRSRPDAIPGGYHFDDYITFTDNDVEGNIYKIFIDDIVINKGFDVTDVGGLRLVTDSGTTPLVTILFEAYVEDIVITAQGSLEGDFTSGALWAARGGDGVDVAAEQGTLFSAQLNTDTNTAKAYLVKFGDRPMVTTTNYVRLISTSIIDTARLVSCKNSNYSSKITPLIEADTTIIKSLGTAKYDIWNSTTIGSLAVSNVVNTYSDASFKFYRSKYYFGYSEAPSPSSTTGVVGLINFKDNADWGIEVSDVTDDAITLTVDPASPCLNEPFTIFGVSERPEVFPATKTIQTTTVSIPLSSSTWTVLGHQDIKSLENVVVSRAVNVIDATWGTGAEAELTFSYVIKDGDDQYNHSALDTIVVKNVKSDNNPTGAFDDGFNGVFDILTIAPVADPVDGDGNVTVTVTITYSLLSNPGAYDTNSDGQVYLEPDFAKDVDITSQYEFDSGADAHLVGTGMIKLKRGYPVPVGQIGVRYKYYALSVGAVEGFVSVDSYVDGTDLGYIGEIADIKNNSGDVVSVRRCADFRSLINKYFFKNIGTVEAGSSTIKLKDFNLSNFADDLIGKYVVGPGYGGDNGANSYPAEISEVNFNIETGNTELVLTVATGAVEPVIDLTGLYYIGLGSDMNAVTGGTMFDMPSYGTRFTFNEYVKFLLRRLMVYIDRDSTSNLSIKFEDIESQAEIEKLRRNAFKLPITFIEMNPYTLDANDLTLTKIDTPVYHMLDIHNIKKRVDRGEDLLSRTLSDDSVDDQDADHNSGFWNENFIDPSVQDYSDPNYKCTIYDQTYVAPGTITNTIDLEIKNENTTEWVQTGSALTLPYTESRAFGNSKASRFSNLNPFNVIQWEGVLTLNPSIDNWVDPCSVPITDTEHEPIDPYDCPEGRPGDPPDTDPPPPVVEVVTEITNLKTSWGPDSRRGNHAITFNWKTNKGRTGRVNTDRHLSPAVKRLGSHGFDGTYVESIINKRYNRKKIKEYLNAGTHFDIKSPEDWRKQQQTQGSNE